MENIKSQNEYFRLQSDILAQNAAALKELADNSSYPITEHIRRATALYQLSMNTYAEGGNVHSVSENGAEIIPLFLLSLDENESRVALSVNINAETAQFLQSVGVEMDGADTTVLDNIINHYYHLTQRTMDGQKIIVETSKGEKGELVF